MALFSEIVLAVIGAPCVPGLRPSGVQEVPGAYWADFHQPSAERTGDVESIELALATRLGPRLAARHTARGAGYVRTRRSASGPQLGVSSWQLRENRVSGRVEGEIDAGAGGCDGFGETGRELAGSMNGVVDGKLRAVEVGDGGRSMFSVERSGYRIVEDVVRETTERRIVRTHSPCAVAGGVSAPGALVIAKALGYHHETATRLVADAGGTWSRYASGDHRR
ncbi:hypothetical protein [Streptomyces sp. NPDC056527]|uniref:hypothetical protein n=1 Tax=Streptomyces sp. NPDC056527 TaxID=3345853 RepID=UPI0036C50E39